MVDKGGVYLMDMQIRQDLESLEQRLDEGNYRPGPWQRLLEALYELSGPERAALADDVSRVSRKLHQRNGHWTLPFAVGLAGEIIGLALAVAMSNSEVLLVRFVGVIGIALTLQPTLKVVAGLLLGVRYDYVYLWFFEPRFKMRFGTYLMLTAWRRVWLNFVGSLGTPIAMVVGGVLFSGHSTVLSIGFFGLAIGATVMQVGAFAAEWLGVRTVFGFRLSTLTSPATMAMELRRVGGVADESNR